MISRYTRAEMERIWSQENKYRRWLEVETLALEAWETLGAVPKGTAAAVRAKAWIPPGLMDRIESKARRYSVREPVAKPWARKATHPLRTYLIRRRGHCSLLSSPRRA